MIFHSSNQFEFLQIRLRGHPTGKVNMEFEASSPAERTRLFIMLFRHFSKQAAQMENRGQKEFLCTAQLCVILALQPVSQFINPISTNSHKPTHSGKVVRLYSSDILWVGRSNRGQIIIARIYASSQDHDMFTACCLGGKYSYWKLYQPTFNVSESVAFLHLFASFQIPNNPLRKLWI